MRRPGSPERPPLGGECVGHQPATRFLFPAAPTLPRPPGPLSLTGWRGELVHRQLVVASPLTVQPVGGAGAPQGTSTRETSRLAGRRRGARTFGGAGRFAAPPREPEPAHPSFPYVMRCEHGRCAMRSIVLCAAP
ncbi:hypothetical protein Maq22A_c28440 [Methylobacterium aquaticum]|uniref:Uncharacterized protein n=1 Tax=Methylobacterium aquaticum TaxID=270351 RepID=A0A1Y0ZIN5_9HYPH|nr:hypothetical protein Maq22A_c28440 [Methylobacterium aquaticum]